MNTPLIVDSEGNPIKERSIVSVNDGVHSWGGKQGLVVYPHSDAEGDGYTVAVYFYREIDEYNFLHLSGIHGRMKTEDWDERFADQNKSGDTSFLFKEQIWKQSPRIIFFKPEELLVVPRWSIETLTKRCFPRTCHSIRVFKRGMPEDPAKYMCMYSTCRNPATEIALSNVWGTVCPQYVCSGCAKKVHGLCVDTLPEQKPQLLDPSGNPIPIPA